MSDRPMSSDAFDEVMRDFFTDRSRVTLPDGLLDATLQRTGRTRPIGRWALPERWLLGDAVTRRRRRPALLWIAAALALTLSIVALAILGGSGLPPPFGVAAPGLVAYVADARIWVAAPDGSSASPLTSGDRIDTSPTWSRDGTKIAFKRLPPEGSEASWADKGDIFVFDLATGSETLIEARTHSPSPFSWSPDSRAIAYSRDSRPAELAASDGLQDQVFVAPLDGSPPLQVTSGDLAGWAPVWGSTDWLAFVRGYPTIDGIWVTRPDGSDARKLTQGLIESFDQLDWSPDGTKILYSMYSPTVGGSRSIWSVGLDGSAETRLTAGWMPSVSPDGRRVTFLGGGNGAGTTRIYVANIDGTIPFVISDDGHWLAPRWSPDGTRIVAVDARTATPPLVVILDPDRLAPATSFELPPGEGFGRADAPSWQRKATP